MTVFTKNTRVQYVKFIGIGILCSYLSGCAPPEYLEGPYCPGPVDKPIVASKEELRMQVQFMESQTIQKNGKIVVYNDYLLINEPNIGIHIFDNIQPELPQPLGLIKVPGNTDFFVRDDIVHATSYIDLVQIDMSDLDNIHEVSRSEDIFTSDSYRYGWFSLAQFYVDTKKFVVVGIEQHTVPKEGCGEVEVQP